MTHATANVASLRASVLILDVLLGKSKTPALASIVSAYRHWRRHLVRAAACPNLDTLADALRCMDRLRSSLEAAHEVASVAGILRMRNAFAQIEQFIDAVDLADVDAEPPPDEELDLVQDGVVAHALRFVRSTSPRTPRRANSPRPVAARSTRTRSGRLNKAGQAKVAA